MLRQTNKTFLSTDADSLAFTDGQNVFVRGIIPDRKRKNKA